ncbi:NAD(P)/FAD-dependent oxidoreductase [Rhizobium sp. LjRoot254]|uniref:NAD(P)/FAD-dependent oxidoreductase n=1 Tax=Rhizobium sp. LjRoot254 TaxID=3342297 RepID=UPI003ECE5A11
MTPQFQFAIVGRGMTGSAAARHLAEQVPGMALIGPDEPEVKAPHPGVFGSHYDEGRITRTIDPDENWARLANRSIARYRDIEARSGVTFFGEKGCLVAGLTTGRAQEHMADVRQSAAKLGVATVDFDDEGLRATFPYFNFPAGSDAVFEATHAGHISARNLVAAQTKLTELAGGAVIREEVAAIHQRDGHVEIVTVGGATMTAAKVLVATGGFTNRPGLLPERLDLTVYGRTVAFFEVDAEEAARLAAMPALISKREDVMLGIYMLPPIRYPDGRFYLKIGGDPVDIPLLEESDVRAWFRTEGDADTRGHLIANMNALVPDLKVASIHTSSCVTSYTPTGYPAIGWTSAPSIAVMAGGCGAAAKSSDEIGRLGAELLLHGRIIDQAYRADFTPQFL